jgi:hypothetical protein
MHYRRAAYKGQRLSRLDPGVTAGVGAPLDFAEYEAENGVTNGRIVGPDRTFATLASEASGRRAVLLEGPGDYVEFRLSAPVQDFLQGEYGRARGQYRNGRHQTTGLTARVRKAASGSHVSIPTQCDEDPKRRSQPRNVIVTA